MSDDIKRSPTFVVTMERRYAFDIERILRDFRAEIEDDMARGLSLDASLQETFCELCGGERDEDHIDGKYVWLVDFCGEFDAWGEWADIVKRAEGLL